MRNPLLDRDGELFARLATFARDLNTMLIDHLAVQTLQQAGFSIQGVSYSFSNVRATAIVLRVLTKSAWNEHDIHLLDLLWRQVIATDLFGGEFEAERFRIQHGLQTARQQLRRSPHQGLWDGRT